MDFKRAGVDFSQMLPRSNHCGLEDGEKDQLGETPQLISRPRYATFANHNFVLFEDDALKILLILLHPLDERSCERRDP